MVPHRTNLLPNRRSCSLLNHEQVDVTARNMGDPTNGSIVDREVARKGLCVLRSREVKGRIEGAMSSLVRRYRCKKCTYTSYLTKTQTEHCFETFFFCHVSTFRVRYRFASKPKPPRVCAHIKRVGELWHSSLHPVLYLPRV